MKMIKHHTKGDLLHMWKISSTFKNHTMKYYLAIKGASNDSHDNLDGFQRIYTEWKKQNPKCCILCDFIYITFDMIA